MRQPLVTAALIVIIVIALAPMAALYWASWFAARHSCSVTEGFTRTCIVDGRDFGPILDSAFASGWLMLIGLPVALLSLLYLIIRLRRAARTRRAG